jgi:hypothetical protein
MYVQYRVLSPWSSTASHDMSVIVRALVSSNKGGCIGGRHLVAS